MAFLSKLKELPDTGVVSVACRLPNGLRLDLPSPNDPRQEIPFATLRGWSQPEGAFNPYIAHRVGVTTGIDAAKFKHWFESMMRNKFAPVIEGMIFAFASETDVRARAKEEEARPQANARLDPKQARGGITPEDGKETA